MAKYSQNVWSDLTRLKPIVIALLILTLFLPTLSAAATNNVQASPAQYRAQIVKERKAHKQEVHSLRHQLRARWKSDSLEAIRFGAMVTGGSYRAGVALVNCETGGTFSPLAYNSTPLSGSHATALWQWLYPSSWLNSALNRFGSFNIYNPYIQSVASYELRKRAGSWFNGWGDICGTRADQAE